MYAIRSYYGGSAYWFEDAGLKNIFLISVVISQVMRGNELNKTSFFEKRMVAKRVDLSVVGGSDDSGINKDESILRSAG